MQKWEYRIGKMQTATLRPKGNQQITNLDPTLLQEKGSYWLIESINGYYTHLQKGLNEFGDDGWELVGTTPPLNLPVGDRTFTTSMDTTFYLLFKRLK